MDIAARIPKFLILPALLVALTALGGCASGGNNGGASSGSTTITAQLKALHEPLFSRTSPASGTEEVRLLFVPAFQKTVVIRVTRFDNKATMRVARMNGQGGSYTGAIDYENERELPSSDWEVLHSLVNKVPFWNNDLPEEEASSANGSYWILESVDEQGYRAIRQWSPAFEPMPPGSEPFQDCCKFLLDLSGLVQGAR